jgi:hypothetical protein
VIGLHCLGPHPHRCQHRCHAPPNPTIVSRRYHPARGRYLSPQYRRHPTEHHQHRQPLWPTPPPAPDGQSKLMRCNSCHHYNTFQVQGRNMEAKNGVNQQLMAHSYQVDTSKKDQGRALLDEGSRYLRPEKDNPATTDATAPTTGKGDETYKTLSKQSIIATTKANTCSLQVRVYQCEAGLQWRAEQSPRIRPGAFRSVSAKRDSCLLVEEVTRQG